MDFHYVDTPEIKVSLGMTTGQIRQIINFLQDLNKNIEEGFEKQILMSHIMRLQDIYQRTMINLETYAQGQQTNA